MHTRSPLIPVLAGLMWAAAPGAAFSQFDKLNAGDSEPDDNFGYSLSMSDSTIVVGAWQNDSLRLNSGAAYIFERQLGSNMWASTTKLIPDNADFSGDEFGRAVGVDRNRIIVGAQYDDDVGTDRGAAYIFERSAAGENTWTQKTKLVGIDSSFRDKFGRTVAISGTVAIVGAPEDDDQGSNSGSVYVFERSNIDGSWSETAKLLAEDGMTTDGFGSAVAVDGMTIVIGASEHNHDGISNTGAAYVFERDSSNLNWTQIAKLTANDRDELDRFGLSVDIDGTHIIVGAPFDDDQDNAGGSAYVFDRDPTSASWSQAAKLRAIDPAIGDQFGHAVSLSGGQAIVASLQDDDQGEESGSVTLFQRQPDQTWTALQTLVADDGAPFDQFGFDLTIANGVALVGAPEDDDHGDEESGSAYLYELPLDPTDVIFTASFGDE